MEQKDEANYYGVLIGQDGPKIYSTWTECEEAISDIPDACYAGFATRQEAEAWIDRWALDDVSYRRSPSSRNRFESPCDSSLLRSSDVATPAAELLDRQYELNKFEESDVAGCDVVIEGARPELRLSAGQMHALERVKQGENVFFTGSAGTGKSVLLRKIIETLGGLSASVAVTASTGIAAVNIGGTTLHSFAGVGLGKGKVDALVEKVQDSRYASKRWQSVKTLIIDEVSMIDGRFFDLLNRIARTVRGISAPFGGIQLVVSGDFCQLPPVPDQLDGVSLPIKFAFDADSWNACFADPVILQKVFRQEDRGHWYYVFEDFVRMLNKMRYGDIEAKDELSFLALSRPVVYDDGIEPTELFPLRVEVEGANAARLANLPGPSHTYLAHDVPGTDSRRRPLTLQQAEKLLERLVAVKQVTLKIGAQVMLIKNLSQGRLVNGLLGKVVAFKSAFQAIHDNIPLSIPERNQADRYCEAGVNGTGVPDLDKISSQERVWPLVHFTNGDEVLCIPVTFDVVNARGDIEAKREQIPLILAWAMSVHKSQGQTLERVRVNLARTFEKGQAYVAISRARRMETLQILHFNRSKVMAHPRVLEWNAQAMQEIQRKEEISILQEMDNEEAIKAFFEDDDII